MKCLYCYKPIENGTQEYHPACSRKIFGFPVAPVLEYNEKQMTELAKEIIQSQISVTGVQPKISLHIHSDSHPDGVKRFTIVGMWGGYILKPPTPLYLFLPEVEDLTMKLAELSKIKTVPHSLIRLKSGKLAYITKRIDRVKKTKLPMEDMCQLTERLSEEKYNGSYEQIAKAILKYSATPVLDVVDFYEQVLFSFITGNADMHLKNFSLIFQEGIGHILSPAYDMVATALVNPADDEELALTLNGKKKKITRNDFLSTFTTSGLELKQQLNIFKKMKKALPKWEETINESFLPSGYQKTLRNLIAERMARINE